ncbi:MAG TPA: hypothetical protein VGV12_13390 [Gemmatimonadales bacterium]|nr:hypothetical protein [Gemmatimonadales bacterium]
MDLLDPGQERVRPDAFGYQFAALDRTCRELPGDSTETAHLIGLVRATGDAYRARDAQLVVPALLAYAHYLEDELLLNEALDVLETVVRVGGEALRSSDRVASRLWVARVLRKLNEFDASEEAYEEAGALAAASGDQRSELLSRIGRARTASGRGNLVEGERCLRGVLADADRLADRDVRARAHQEMAVVLNARGQPAEAIPHEWLAFQLYEDEPSRMRVLTDVGIMLLKVGEVEAAERALIESQGRSLNKEVVDSASIELMHCASFRRDRVGFERWRERCEARSEFMPPNMLADFTLKAAIGRARFGQFDRADVLMATALLIAQRAGLHEAAFRIERIKNGLRDCRDAWAASHDDAAEPVFLNTAVREVSDALGHLVT